VSFARGAAARGLLAALALGALVASAVAPAAADPPLAPREARIYQQICAQCHARPGIGVPQVGDPAAWRERAARGLDALVASTVNGVRGMPPLGTCSFCSEGDFRELAAFMAGLPAPPLGDGGAGERPPQPRPPKAGLHPLGEAGR
jgi:cytochrome c5